MATAWNTADYPLSDRTRFAFIGKTSIDRSSDGTIHTRITTTQNPVNVYVSLSPMSAATSQLFEGDIFSAQETEYEIVHNGVSYTGHIDMKSLNCSISHGALYWWSFMLIANGV